MDWASNDPSVPASCPNNYYNNFIILTTTTSSYLPSFSSSWGEKGQCGWLSISLPKVSKLFAFCCSQHLHHHLFYPVHNNLEGSSAHQPPVNLQCVLEEKRVSVDSFLSACPKYPICYKLQLVPLPPAVGFNLQMSCRCQRCIKTHSWKKEDFRRVPRWKISHGRECKAENGLRHSALSVSKWLVNSLVWRTKFQYSTHQDGGGRSKNGLIKIEVLQDDQSSHQDEDTPHVHQLLYQDLHAGIQQHKETNVIIIQGLF